MPSRDEGHQSERLVNPRTGFISNKGGTFISNEATAFISNQVFNPLNKSKMIQYEVQLNQGNEALQTGKTITANEILLTCDEKALAREIHHQNSLIPS